MVAEWAAERYGWTLEYILHGVPASALALFQRQARVAGGTDDTMPLEVEQEIREAAQARKD